MYPYTDRETSKRKYMLSKISQREVLYDTTYIWNLKNNIKESMYKTETDSKTKTNSWLPKGREGAREGQILQSMGLMKADHYT